MTIKRCEIEKLDSQDKCRERARHTLHFKYRQLGKKKGIKIRICETHRQIFDANDYITSGYGSENRMGSDRFTCTLIPDKI